MADMKDDNTIEIVEQKEAVEENQSDSKSITFDEFISRAVKKYPVIYDKSYKDFHERDVKDNAWQAVALEVGLRSGQEAEKHFRLLRDRYQRAKMTMQRKEAVTHSPATMARIQTRLNNMSYLRWLDDHIKPRTKLIETSIGMMGNDDMEGQVEILDGSDCISEVESETEYSSSSVVPNTMVQTKRKLSPSMVHHTKLPKVPSQTHFTNEPKQRYVLDEQSKHNSYAMQDSCNARDHDNQKTIYSADIRNITVLKDSAQIFGDFVADQLRQLTRDQAVEARYKISGVFYSLMHNSPEH